MIRGILEAVDAAAKKGVSVKVSGSGLKVVIVASRDDGKAKPIEHSFESVNQSAIVAAQIEKMVKTLTAEQRA